MDSYHSDHQNLLRIFLTVLTVRSVVYFSVFSCRSLRQNPPFASPLVSSPRPSPQRCGNSFLPLFSRQLPIPSDVQPPWNSWSRGNQSLPVHNLRPCPRPIVCGAGRRSCGETPRLPGSAWRRRDRAPPRFHRRSTWTSFETSVTTIRPGVCHCQASPPPPAAAPVASCPGSNATNLDYRRPAAGPCSAPVTNSPRSLILDRCRPPPTGLGHNCPHRYLSPCRRCCSRSAAAKEVRHSSG